MSDENVTTDTDTTEEKQFAAAAAAYLKTATSGKGIGDQGHPRAAEAYILTEAPFAAASAGNDMGCEMAQSVQAFGGLGLPGATDLAAKFKTDEAGRQAVVGVLTMLLAVTTKQVQSVIRIIEAPDDDHENKFIAFNAGCNVLLQLAAILHAVKDLSGEKTPEFMIDAMVNQINALSKSAEKLVASRDAEAPKTVH